MKSNEKGVLFPETDLNTLLELINYVFTPNFLLTSFHFYTLVPLRYSLLPEEPSPSHFKLCEIFKVTLIW